MYFFFSAGALLSSLGDNVFDQHFIEKSHQENIAEMKANLKNIEPDDDEIQTHFVVDLLSHMYVNQEEISKKLMYSIDNEETPEVIARNLFSFWRKIEERGVTGFLTRS